VQEFPTSPKTKPRSADDLTKIGQMRADHLVVTISRCPSTGVLLKLVAVVRRNIEQSLSLHTIISRLQVNMAKLHKDLAQIDSTQFTVELGISSDKKILEGKRNILAVTPTVAAPFPSRLEFAAGTKPEFLPLEYQIRILEAQIITAEENLKKTQAMYGYTEKLLVLWQRCLDELQRRHTERYRLDDYLAFLKTQSTTYEDGDELKGALQSHVADIRALLCTNGPDTAYPTIERESKGTVPIVALVFAASLLVFFTGVFMAESVHGKRAA